MEGKLILPVKRPSSTRLNRYFHYTWEDNYFVIPYDEQKVFCLICHTTLVMKLFNVRRHFDVKHTKTHGLIAGEERVALIQKLKDDLPRMNEPAESEAQETTNESAVRASFNIALSLAKEGRPFTDGESVKECMISSAEVMCPSAVEKFRTISVSTNTISRRVQELGNDLKEQLRILCTDFQCFSLALDESIDVNDTAQLAVFIRGVTNEFTVTEELLSIISLKDTTTADDVFLAVEEVLEDMELPLGKLCSLATDGDNGLGFADRILSKVLSEGLPAITVIHCLLHPEQLCAKTCTDFHSLLNVVTRCVHFCKKRDFDNQDFQDFLSDCDAQCRDVSFHCDARWRSCAKVFKIFFALRKEVALFMDEKGSPEERLSDNEFIANLAFLNDVINLLSELNESMQGRNHLISAMWDRIRSFKLELLWFEKQLLERNVEEFASLRSLTLPDDYDFSKYCESLCKLQEEFDRRFKEIDDMHTDITVFMTPFFIPYDEAPLKYQRELIRLQNNTILKDRYYATKNLTDFYKFLPSEDYPKLHASACRFVSMFGSTHIGEQIFSVMNLNRCKMRSRMSDNVLEAILRIHSAQAISPNIDRLVESKRCQGTSIKQEKV